MNFKTVPLRELVLKGIAAQTGQQKPVVLVVDDERVIADTLAAILRQSGFAALAAYEGRSALEIALANSPELLLTDVAMPGMNGIDLAIAVRKAIPECRVLLFSGQATTAGLLADAHEAGHDFTTLQKPLHPKELLVRISETLEVTAARKESVCV